MTRFQSRGARVVLVAVVVTAAGLAGAWAVRRWNGETGVLALTGIVEGPRVKVSATITGRISELWVREGQPVERGQVLGMLETTELTVELARAAADLREAEARLGRLNAGPPPEQIRDAEARAVRAEARLAALLAGTRVEDVELARAAHRTSSILREWNQRELARAREFLARELIGPQDVERARHVYESALASESAARERLVMLEAEPQPPDVASARAELDAARQRVRRLRAKAPPREIEAARARLAAARHELDRARARLGEARLVSPIAGLVLRRNFEAGEIVDPGVSILTLMDRQDLWVRVHVLDAHLRRVRLGQEAAVHIEMYPGRVFAGHVSEIAPTGVKVAFRHPVEGLRPGAPAVVEIRP